MYNTRASIHPATIRTDRGWNVHNAEMITLLGLSPKSKLPLDGMPKRVIQGVTVWVEPFTPKFRTVRRWNGTAFSDEPVPVKSSKHRILAECPSCRKILSAGRLFQHRCPSMKG
jgi:hypothetical protein